MKFQTTSLSKKKSLNRKKIKYRNTDKVKLGVDSLRAKEIIK